VAFWYPTFWLSGGIKAGTAAVSLATPSVLVPLVLKALALPSPAQLEALNGQLREQIQERQQTEVALRQANDALESRVQERTTALSAANEALQHGIIGALSHWQPGRQWVAAGAAAIAFVKCCG
jgi:two-component system, cell cycle sensor histidine kinase and response regulator CckA